MENKANQWLQIDMQLKQIQSKAKELRIKRDELETELIEADSELLQKNQLKKVQVNQSETLTFKYLDQCLNKIIKNPDQAKQIFDYIKKNRNVNSFVEIRRVANT